MNAILESPVEALAFNYWSFDVANIVWTWVAVVTAAVSFWKMKASSSTRLPTPPEPALVTVLASSSSSSQVELMLLSSKERTPPSNNNNMMMLSDDAFSVTKRKLTVYFKQDEDGDQCNTGDDNDQEGEEDHNGVEWFENNWEKLRKGEMGWYCYQDMKVINGNIVRLWDGQVVEKT